MSTSLVSAPVTAISASARVTSALATSPDVSSRVPFTCDEIWTLVASAYDSTLVHDYSYAPDRTTFAAAIEEAGGFACAYTSTRNGNRITLAVAKGAPGSFSIYESSIAANSRKITKFGPPSELRVYKVKGRGHRPGDYEIFTNGYWISATSNLFHTPNGATPLINATLETIRQ
jgi:hypothetical protein